MSVKTTSFWYQKEYPGQLICHTISGVVYCGINLKIKIWLAIKLQDISWS